MILDRKTDEFLLAALNEDIGDGDITTECTVKDGTQASGRYIAKEDGIVCGVDIACRVFELLGGKVNFKKIKNDGDTVVKGDVIAEVSGEAKTILIGERTGLNIMQRLSGIATRTNQAVKAIEGTNAKIADTRKTTPLMRKLEKYAVRVGGGSNHRFGLSDGILIKDNHIAAAGGITKAIESAKAKAPHTIKIEVETETLDQVKEALKAKADIIMLDNMNLEQTKQAVELINGQAITEASGNMGDKTNEQLKAIAETGVDLISIGALTHSVKSLDISLKFKIV
jgi:nicotinate-nucleotide pyrophosphorylase (carboxylating)